MSSGGGFLFKFTAIMAIAVYVLLGSYTVQPGTAYIQDWSLDVASAEVSESFEEADGQWIPFRVLDYFGYAQADGKLLLRSPVRWNVALTSETFCNYNRQGNDLVLTDARRNYLYPLNMDGYPIARGGGYYVLSPDLTGLTTFSSTGEFGFSREFSSLITSLDANETAVGIGLLSGSVELFNQDGSYRVGVRPETSRINVVYGTALSNDSKYLAMVHGIDSQYLSLYALNGANYRLLAQRELAEPTRSQTPVGFSHEGEFLLYKDGESVVILSTEDSTREYVLPIDGELIDFEFLPEFESVYLLSTTSENSVLSIYSEDGRLYSREEFSGEAQWLYSGEDALYLGSGNQLKKILIERSF